MAHKEPGTHAPLPSDHPPPPRPLLMRVIAMLFRILCFPFVKFEYRGAGAIGQHPNWVMAANHRSLFDFPFAVIALAHYGYDARIMVASEFWDKPGFKFALNAINAIPVYRKTDPRGALSAAVEALQGGDSVAIMPEGTIHWRPDDPMPLGPVKTGVSRLAVGSNTPVLGIALIGSERVWGKRNGLPSLFPRKTVLCRLVDEPLWLTSEDHRENAMRVQQTIQALVVNGTRDLQAIDPRYMPTVALDPGPPAAD